MNSVYDQADFGNIRKHSLPSYEDLPSFGIYVDQLVSYVNKAVSVYYTQDEKLLTATMVNNYVKQKVIPKPEKKKYNKDHIAYLIVLCLLKKVFSITEITELIGIQVESHPVSQAYDSFISMVKTSIEEVFSSTCSESKSYDALSENALLLRRVVDAFSNKMYAQTLSQHLQYS